MEERANEAFDVYRELYVGRCSFRSPPGEGEGVMLVVLGLDSAGMRYWLIILVLGNSYYEGGVSSVYLWDLDVGFAGVVLLRKGLSQLPPYRIQRFHPSPPPQSPFLLITSADRSTAVSPNSKTEGTWNSVHVFEAQDRGAVTYYKLTSTVILHLGAKSETIGGLDLSGYLNRQTEQTLPAHDDAGQIVNVGKVRRAFFRACSVPEIGWRLDGWRQTG